MRLELNACVKNAWIAHVVFLDPTEACSGAATAALPPLRPAEAGCWAPLDLTE